MRPSSASSTLGLGLIVIAILFAGDGEKSGFCHVLTRERDEAQPVDKTAKARIGRKKQKNFTWKSKQTENGWQ